MQPLSDCFFFSRSPSRQGDRRRASEMATDGLLVLLSSSYTHDHPTTSSTCSAYSRIHPSGPPCGGGGPGDANPLGSQPLPRTPSMRSRSRSRLNNVLRSRLAKSCDMYTTWWTIHACWRGEAKPGQRIGRTVYNPRCVVVARRPS